jgi:ABC-type transporter Mla subunit MlaD
VPFGAQFEDVQGVKLGSTVRMGGVDVGTVSRLPRGNPMCSGLEHTA